MGDSDRTIDTFVSEFNCHIERTDRNSYRWLNRIVPNIDIGTFLQIVQKIRQTENVSAAAFHQETEGGHAHIYHACNYGASTCRCVVFRDLKHVKRRKFNGRRIIRCSDVGNKEYWHNWFKYFNSEERQVLHVQLAKDYRWSNVFGCENLRHEQEPAQIGLDELMEICDFSIKDCHQKQEDNQSSEGTEEATDNREQSLSRCEKQIRIGYEKRMKIQSDLLFYIRKFLVVPFQSTCQIRPWLTTPNLSFYSSRNLEYTNAIDQFKRQTAFYDFHTLVNIYNEATPYWYARTDLPEQYYYNQELSMQIIEELLMFQAKFNSTDIKTMVNEIYFICEKLKPKMNTLNLYGDANSGKSFFVDMLVAFYLNVGHVGNFVRGQNFPLNDCGSRRIIVWQEFNYMPSAIDTIKLLLGGDPCSAAIKYEAHATINRTPVIITSNNNRVPNTPPFKARVKSYHWREATFLRVYDKKPNPLTWKNLVNKYVLN